MGVLLIVAGLIVGLAPTASVPGVISTGWWVAAYRFANAAQGAMSLIAVAVVFGIGLLMTLALERRARSPARVPFAIGVCVTGLTVAVVTWFVAQAAVPTSQVAVAAGQKIESYPAIASGNAFKVMLPRQIYVAEVDRDAGTATIELRRADEEKGARHDTFVGEPMEIGEGIRLALLGAQLDHRTRTAILTQPGGIEVRAAQGSTVKFQPDGPEYEVRRITANYLGFMGPAVEISSEEEGVYWVTARDSALEEPLTDVRLLRIETAPVPVFALTKSAAGGFVQASAAIFAIGLIFLFGFWHRTEQPRTEPTEPRNRGTASEEEE